MAWKKSPARVFRQALLGALVGGAFAWAFVRPVKMDLVLCGAATGAGLLVLFSLVRGKKS